MTEYTEINDSSRPAAAVVLGHYAGLLGEGWWRLPDAVRRRFTEGPAPGATRLYTGTVIATELSPFGQIVAHLARFAGGPMPFTNGAVGPTTVAVTSVADLHGSGNAAQVWTRSYARDGAFPQVIQSAKCFSGPTGLEERLGYCLSMRLKVTAEGRPGAAELVFASTAYLLSLGPLSLTLPAWLSPGRCEVRHRDEGCVDRIEIGAVEARAVRAFTFTLTITHPLFGRVLRQIARYHEVQSA